MSEYCCKFKCDIQNTCEDYETMGCDEAQCQFQYSCEFCKYAQECEYAEEELENYEKI